MVSNGWISSSNYIYRYTADVREMAADKPSQNQPQDPIELNAAKVWHRLIGFGIS